MKRSPISLQGERSRRLAEWHAWSRSQTQKRAYQGGEPHCEAGVYGYPCKTPDVRTEWAHLFGRGNIIGEPWCSLPEMTMQLCPTCHQTIDRARDLTLRGVLRWACLLRLAHRHPVVDSTVREFVALTPFADSLGYQQGAIDCARACTRLLVVQLDREALPELAPNW